MKFVQAAKNDIKRVVQEWKIIRSAGTSVIPTVTNIGDLIASADAKATLVDTDIIAVSNSAASDVLVGWSYAALKAQLTTYLITVFNSLYVKVTDIIAIAKGGTGQTTAQDAINALTQVSAATVEHVLTKDTATGNAIFKAAGGGGGGGGAHSPIATIDLAAWGSHQVDIDLTQAGYNDTYDFIYIKFADLERLTAPGELWISFSEDSLSTFLTNYGRLNINISTSTTFKGDQINGLAYMRLAGSNAWDSPKTLSGEVLVGDINSTVEKNLIGHTRALQGTTGRWHDFGSTFISTAALTHIRIETEDAAEDFNGGKIYVMGVKYD